jgi:hypothetical protein
MRLCFVVASCKESEGVSCFFSFIEVCMGMEVDFGILPCLSFPSHPEVGVRWLGGRRREEREEKKEEGEV